MHVKLKV